MRIEGARYIADVAGSCGTQDVCEMAVGLDGNVVEEA